MSQAVKTTKLCITVDNLAVPCRGLLDLAADLCGQMCCCDLTVGSRWQHSEEQPELEADLRFLTADCAVTPWAPAEQRRSGQHEQFYQGWIEFSQVKFKNKIVALNVIIFTNLAFVKNPVWPLWPASVSSSTVTSCSGRKTCARISWSAGSEEFSLACFLSSCWWHAFSYLT